MVLNSLNLTDFRNHERQKLEFKAGVNLVIGKNASGKTNLLEAIYLLASGRSLRAGIEAEMIRYQQALSRIEGIVVDEQQTKLEIVLTRGSYEGQPIARKRYLVNGLAKRRMDFIGQLEAVYFGPEDLEIIIGSPSVRRDFLDAVLEQVDREYRRVNLSYQKGLRQRNRLLEQIRDEGRSRSSLFFWDRLLIENGSLINSKREQFINYLNQQETNLGRLVIKYDRSVISETRLEQYAEAEVAAATTLVGPHRDDFIVGIKDSGPEDRNLHIFGSRGEQRAAVFMMKLAQLSFMKEKSSRMPVLLLDDLFSELDSLRRGLVLRSLPNVQVILTTTEPEITAFKELTDARVIELNHG